MTGPRWRCESCGAFRGMLHTEDAQRGHLREDPVRLCGDCVVEGRARGLAQRLRDRADRVDAMVDEIEARVGPRRRTR